MKVTTKFNVQSGDKAQAGGVAFRVVDKDNYYVARANGNEANFALFHTIGGNREKLMEGEAPTGLNAWLSVTAEAKGNDITVYAGATKLFKYTETNANAPKAGGVGLWTKDDSVTLFDDFSVDSGTASPPSYAPAPAMGGPTGTDEDFEPFAVGSVPEGWVVINGTWKVGDDTHPTNPTKVLRQSATNIPFPLIEKTDAGNYTDVETKVEFNVLSGTLAQAGGIAFRIEDADNYYVARANGNEANWAIFHTINGNREKIGEAVAPTGLNTWLNLRVQAKGDLITLFANNTKVLTVTETNPAAPKSGYLGLWTKDDSIVLFDNFEAEPI